MNARVRTIGFVAQARPPADDPRREHLISAALLLANDAAAYYLSERLSELYPTRAVLETQSDGFDVEAYARAGHCTVAHLAVPHSQRLRSWYGPREGVVEHTLNSWLEVTWQDDQLDLLVATWHGETHYYLLAAQMAVAEQFLAAVCAWNAQPHEAVLVFESGRWTKDEELFAAIRGANFDRLILREGLKKQILNDATRFFAAQATYTRYGVPWKRGLLFAGPPGNGKTHTIKALINTLGQTCLYVKSFRRGDAPDEYSMRAVFAQARISAPCVLVLEDLDTLVTGRNRSFFLNEMDGFAANGGILTLGTTNHPERLDAAIARRPSRFDRTYCFDLPALAERQAYLTHWNESLQPEMRLGTATVASVAALTEDYSFAYLKELLLSATLQWLAEGPTAAMDTVIAGQVDLLREQMLSTTTAAETPDGGACEERDTDE